MIGVQKIVVVEPGQPHRVCSSRERIERPSDPDACVVEPHEMGNGLKGLTPHTIYRLVEHLAALR